MTAAFDLHVFGLNMAAADDEERASLAFSRGQVERVLRALAVAQPSMEAVVVRARNHVEAFLSAPAGSPVVRAWVGQLRSHRPDLLHPSRRPLHYHLAGASAHRHLARLASGRYASDAAVESFYPGLKAALGLAARCGTLGETLDGLFLHALRSPAPEAIRSRVSLPLEPSTS